MIDAKTIKDKNIVPASYFKKESEEFDKRMDSAMSIKEEKSFFSKIGDALKKAIDCCKE
jgi:hypothetical protein